MARVGEESAKRANKAGAKLQRLRCGGGDSDGRKKRTSVVNPDPWHSIYRGVHWVRPLWLLPPYGARCNGSITVISQGNHAAFFAKRVRNNLSSEFRPSDTTASPGHPDDNISILTRSTSPHITLIWVFDKSFCQNDQIHDRRKRTLHGSSEGTQVACDLTGSRPDTER
jgi:hypothetical protein